jgi:hypothetical protein
MTKRRLFRGIESLPPRGHAKAAGSDEHSEQVTVCDALDAAGVCYFAVPNGANVSKRERAKLVAEGLKAGVTDLVVIDPPPARHGAPGVALEMKRRKGGRLSKVQKGWGKKFEDRGWIWIVAKGADDAIYQLRRLGYEI